MKYSLSPMRFPRAEPMESPEGSGYISPYIQTQVIIQNFFNSNILTFSIGFPWRTILKELILHIAPEQGLYFPVLPSRRSNLQA